MGLFFIREDELVDLIAEFAGGGGRGGGLKKGKRLLKRLRFIVV